LARQDDEHCLCRFIGVGTSTQAPVADGMDHSPMAGDEVLQAALITSEPGRVGLGVSG